MTRIYSDGPLTDPRRDELDVMPFVRRLLYPLLEWPTDESLVVGLYGPWGYGKSTVLHFLRDELEKPRPSARSAIVVPFNPWLYSTPEVLLASFFGTLAAKLKGSKWGMTSKQQAKVLGTALSGVGTFVGLAAASVGAPALAPMAKKAVKGLGDLLQQGEADFHQRKAAASSQLRALGTREPKSRVVVLIDDVDRADVAEVLALMKLLKLIADLPNISYVITMDERRVRKLLESKYAGESGAEYLEKIVQIPIHLPLIAPDKLRDLVKGSLRAVAEEAGFHGDALFSGSHGGDDLYDGTIGMRVRTLRDRAQLANAYRFFLVTGTMRDISPLDALLLTFVNVFYPDVYSRLREHKVFLTGNYTVLDAGAAGHAASTDPLIPLRHLWIQIVDGRDPSAEETQTDDALSAAVRTTELRPVDRVLRLLFPRALTVWPSDRLRERVNNRISDPDRFDRYFRLAAPAHELPDRAIDEMIQQLGRIDGERPALERQGIAKALVEALPNIADPETCASFLEKFSDRLMFVPDGSAQTYVDRVLDLEPAFRGDALFPSLRTLIGRAVLERQGTDAESHELVASLLTVIVERLPDPIGGLLFVQAYGRQPITPGPRETIARAVLIRMKEYAASGLSVYDQSEPPPERILNAWRVEERAAGNTGTDLRDYLRSLIVREPALLSRYLLSFTEPAPDPGDTRPYVMTLRQDSPDQIDADIGKDWLKQQAVATKDEREVQEADEYWLIPQFLALV